MKNKFITTLVLALVLSFSTSAFAQNEESGNYKPLNFRIYGAPELQWMLKGDSSTTRGGRLGFNSGMEILYDLSPVVELYSGLYFNVMYFDRWIDFSDSFGSAYASERGTFFEIPLGAQFNFTKLAPSGFFAGISYINSFNLHSQSKKYIPNPYYEQQDNTVEKTMSLYNFGFKGEIGYKFNYDDSRRYSLSLGIKPMFYNYIGGDYDKFLTLSTSLMLGVYF